MHKITKTLSQLYKIYQRNFHLFLPLSLFVLVGLFVQQIPYLNLIAPLVSTAAFFITILVIFQFLKTSKHVHYIFAGILIFLSFIFTLFHFFFFSEVLGNVLYLLLAYLVIRELYFYFRTVHK
jgi:hypothetical protein